MTDRTFVPVAIPTGPGTFLQFVGERVAPGLVITPGFDPDGHFDGFWDLRHEPSGQAFSTYAFEDMTILRRAAERLTAAGFDWTASPDLFTDAMKRCALKVMEAAYESTFFGNPVPEAFAEVARVRAV